MKKLKKIDGCTYKVGDTGYFVERMENGLWDAYLPQAWDRRLRLWESIRHATRKAAITAAGMERRRINKAVKRALST